MKRLIVLPIILNGMLAAQDITVGAANWRQIGISLVSSSDPEFAGLASHLTPPSAPDLTPALPYSFVLRNGTGKAIIALGVRWTCTNAAGKTQTHDRMWINHTTAGNGGTVSAGADRLVTPILSVGTSLTPAKLAKELERFQGMLTITPSLEAVILSDGTALGPDANNTIPRVQARLDAEKHVLASISAAWQQGGASALTEYLQGVITAAPLQHGDMAAVKARTPSLAYAMVFSDVEREHATGLLKKASTDPGVVAAFAQRLLVTRDYPDIHRQ